MCPKFDSNPRSNDTRFDRQLRLLELELQLWKSTKDQLVEFLLQAGVRVYDPKEALKIDLVIYAMNKQEDAWYPRSTDRAWRIA
jgi:hypothetical protein